MPDELSGPAILRPAFRTLALLAGSLCAGAVPAQPLPGPIDPSRPSERPLPELRPAPAAPGLVLPPVPPPAGDAPLSSGARVRVARFRIVGNTVFGEEDLRRLIAAYEGREIGNEELEEARAILTRHYIAQGYISSGAVIPDQQVRDGVVTLRIIEGRLSEITVSGENRFHPDFVRKRLRPSADEPLNVARLQERAQLLLQNPQIERINAELGPGLRPGEAVLGVDLKEAPRYDIGYTIANDRSPAIGGERQEVRGALRNLSGRGEELNVRAGKAQGLDDRALMLAVPVSARDTLAWVRLEEEESRVIEAPFSVLEIEARTDYAELGVKHPFHRTLNRELSLGAALALRNTQTFLLGTPFSFTPGLVDGRSRVAVLRLSTDLVERTTDRVSAARITLNQGLDAFHSTHAPFLAFLVQAQRAQRLLQGRSQLLARFDLQAASESLPNSEKFSLGGAESVRGYREDLLVRDTGWNASIEYRHRVLQLPLRLFADTPEDGWISLVPFIDAGQARDREGPNPSPETLSSIGLGARWDVARGVQAAVYRGFALRELENRSDDLQDRGWHFRLAVQKSF